MDNAENDDCTCSIFIGMGLSEGNTSRFKVVGDWKNHRPNVARPV